MKKISTFLIMAIILNSSGFVGFGYADVIQQTDISSAEAYELEFEQDGAGSAIADISGGDGNSSMGTAVAVVGILLFIGAIAAVAASNNEEE